MTRHLPGDPDCWRTCTHEATPPPAVARQLDAHLLDIADRRRATVATDPFPRSLPTNPDGSLRALRSDPLPRGLYRETRRPFEELRRAYPGDPDTLRMQLWERDQRRTAEAATPTWRRLWDTRGDWGYFALLYPTVAAGLAVLLARRLTRGR